MAHTMNGLSEAMQSQAGAGLQPNGFLGHYHYHQLPPNHFQHYNNSGSPNINKDSNQESPNVDGHVTVVQIEQKQPEVGDPVDQHYRQHRPHTENGQLTENSPNGLESDFVTVLTIASSTSPLMTSSMSNSCYPVLSSLPTLPATCTLSSQKVFVDNRRGEIEEEVTIYRLPGERLGMALRFDGGQSVCQTIRRVFVQSISGNSPASKAIGLMLGILREGDEILQIDGRHSSTLTRHECITLLRDAPVCIRLFVRRSPTSPCLCCQSYVVPNCAHPTLPPCCPNASIPGPNEHELVPHQPNGLSTSSAPSSVFVSSSETHLLPNLSDHFKKVPPPVPPRMATTTLSIKRKSKPVPTFPEIDPSSLTVTEISNTNALDQVPPIEKPPRRKNQVQAGNPPPLPPRRPKGPPPKPPTERTVEPSSVMTMTNVSSSTASITTTSTKSVPSLVTVITTKVCDVMSTSHCKQSLAPTKTSSIGITITSPTTSSSSCRSSHIKTSATSKVTFTISNSKVSSFIRQTAEKLHRKLSGKSTSEENEDGKHGHKSSQTSLSPVETSNSVKINVSREAKFPTEIAEQTVISLKSEPTEKQQKPPEYFSTNDLSAFDLEVPSAAVYMDSCQDIDTNSFIESDTDDTSSSVSTIIERSSINSVIFNDNLMPHFENFAHQNILPEHEFDLNDMPMPKISPQTVSMVNRVLSPFERIEREFDIENQNGPISLSSFGNAFPHSFTDNEHTFRSLSLLPNQSINYNRDQRVQLSPNKTCALIVDDQLVTLKDGQSSVAKSEDNCQIKSPSSIPVDTDFLRDYENVQVLREKPPESVESFTENSLLLEPPKEFASTENGKIDLKENSIENKTNEVVDSVKVESVQLKNLLIDEEDDEDFDVMKNDIISRVDDDKDDFMLDTNYLNESSARYLFHHSGSELILAPYSELSSITEEDEEDEISSNLDSKQTPLTDNLQIDVQPAYTMDCLEAEQTTDETIAHCVKEESQSIEFDCNIINSSNGDAFEEPDRNNMKHLDDSDSDQRSDSSNSSSQKVSLNNVFDFLNEAADDFEFVERMLELTNDKIDSIDDIMRIRESLRGLQQSEQRGNLQRFLDGKDVIDELMALSSPTHSTASSLEGECQMSDGIENDLSGKSEDNKQLETQTMARVHSKPLSNANDDVSDEFTSLPVCFSNSDHHSNGIHRIGAHPLSMLNENPLHKDKCDPRVLSNGNLSKIPTLAPKLLPGCGTLGKRSQSVSNIFNRSNGFNSLIELRPSLIPRPISNFNLSLPSSSLARSNHPSPHRVASNGHVYSHNCLNRSTSMQSIPSNSLSRPTGKNKSFVRRASATGSGQQWNNSTNYHHNCLRNQDPNPTYYGSLSRSVSRSTANVFNTGSLPRVNKPIVSKVCPIGSSQGSIGHYCSNGNLRTSSLIDLTYGFAPNKSRLVQPNLAPSNSSRRHSSSNLYLCDSVQSNDIVSYSQCHSQVQQNSAVKSTKSPLRTSSSLISLLPSTNSSSHFWHCSHHTPSTSPPNSVNKTKRSINGSSGKVRPNSSQAQLNGKVGKTVARKPSKSLSCTSSSSSTKSESDDQQTAQTRSILRHSSASKFRTLAYPGERQPKSDNDCAIKELDYWNQTVNHRKRRSFELNSHSDSENSDITISSGDSGDCLRSAQSKTWQSKRRNSHKVCFVDEIVQHPTTENTVCDIDYRSSVMEVQQEEGNKQMPPKVPSILHGHCNEERFDSSSPEMPVLSSSTSTSSISSLSSGELAKMCSSRLRPKEQDKQSLNGNLPKSIFLVVSTQREDSGIFASDDNSTSEFSQSPSPELLMGSGMNPKMSQTDESHSVKERIAFFDPVTNKAMDLNRSLSCNKSNAILTSVSGQVLSRSCSAPYETHCEFGAKLSEQGEHILLTPPQSPPNERSKESIQLDTNVQTPVNYFERHLPGRTETTAFPVTIEYKKPNPFALRDSMITARRYQNTCKLKGLVIPESTAAFNDHEVDSVSASVQSKNQIDLPTIISEETLKVKSSKDFICEANKQESWQESELNQMVPCSSDSDKPIEILAIKATTMNVPKYSPMFKRRPFSLPLNPDINYGLQKKTLIESNSREHSAQSNLKVSTPPAVPPKPKAPLPKLEEITNLSETEPNEFSLVPPPLPPKKKDIKLDFIEANQVTNLISDFTNSETKQNNIDENCPQEASTPSISVESSSPSEFVIRQKQYSMRVIVFELAELDDYAHLGIYLTGGLDSTNKEVTVQHISPNSLASRDGRLQKGDRIVSVNGKLLLGLTHEETVELLQSACHSQKVMIVYSRTHDQNVAELLSPTSVTSPSILESMTFSSTPLVLSSVPSAPLNGIDSSGNNYKTVKAEIAKDVNGLGFIIEGGKNSSLGDRPIMIKRIYRGGPVDKEGSLLEGDELLSVNEQSVHEMTRAEAWNFLKQLPDGKVTLITRRKRYF